MRFQVQFHYLDYKRKDSYTTLNYEGVETFETLDALIINAESVISAMIDATNTHAIAKATIPLGNEHVALPGSSAYIRSLLVCKQGVNYATFSIPCPSFFPKVSTGPAAAYKAEKSHPQNAGRLAALVAFLSNTLTPTGQPFPTEEYEYTLTRVE